jgi:23S rRNA pseudouridine1911/1915/1917 synthase
MRKGAYIVQVSIIHEQLSVTPGRKDGEISAEAFLREKLLLPNGYIRKLFSTGRVRIQGRVAQNKDILKSGQKIWIEGEHRDRVGTVECFPDGMSASEVPCSILFEDKHILVVDKPANLIVHAPENEEEDTVDRRIARYYTETNQNYNVLHIHRLDKGTTGALLYGKHSFIARALDEELRSGLIKRTYLALTFGKNLQRHGEVRAAIGRDRHQSGRYRISSSGKEALTKYKRLSQFETADGTFSLVACRLETGRTHQIRVHLGSIGAPIVGDVMYGGKIIRPFTEPKYGIGLHALSIHFFHPYDETSLDVFAPLPATFSHLYTRIGWDVPNIEKIRSSLAGF